MLSWFKELGAGVREVFCPPVCVHCGELVETESPMRSLCFECERAVHRVEPPACHCCGHPFFGLVHGERTCPHCTGLQPAFSNGKTLVLFKGPARSLMLELKYHRSLFVLRDIEVLVREANHVLEWLEGAVLVPVPMHPRKLRERGYNQTELIAEVVARACHGGILVERHLRRVEDGRSQTAFDRKTRLENLRHAFQVEPKARIDQNIRYVLLDDVFTTGSTLNRCAVALRKAGARRIDVLTYGHG